MNRIVVFAVIAAFALGLGGRLLLDRLQPSNVGAELGAPFTLTDMNGETITEAAFEGEPTVLFFGFTHCPEICPTAIYDLEAWLEEIGPDGEEVGAYFITVDPERDTPDVLREYLEPQSERVVGISGEPADVLALADAWRVYYSKQPLDGGDYTMNHTTLMYLVDDSGQYFGHISYGEDFDTAVAKLRTLIAS